MPRPPRRSITGINQRRKCPAGQFDGQLACRRHQVDHRVAEQCAQLAVLKGQKLHG